MAEPMSPELWQQVERLYFAALERAPEREAFLESACANDEGLKREIESLIAIGKRVGTFMEQPAIGSEITQTSITGRVLGHTGSFLCSPTVVWDTSIWARI
jgi:hypothetical protein